MLGKILLISNVYKYPTHYNQTYRVVQLLLGPSIHRDQTVQTKTILLLLYDDQVNLSSGWREDQVLFIYRPYLMKNSTEVLFGTECDQASTFSYKEVYPMADIIQTLIQCQSPGDCLFDFHLLYGCISICCVIHNMEIASQLSQQNELPIFNQHILKKYNVKQLENAFIDMSKYESNVS